MMFAVDDSEITLEDRPHTILSALGIADEKNTKVALDKLKIQFGIRQDEEIKWNGMRPLPRKQREWLSRELLVLIAEGTVLVTICEGRDKQKAAELLTDQISDYLQHECEEENTIEISYDENIIDAARYASYLRKVRHRGVAGANFSSVSSLASVAIQLADVLSGFNRLATHIAISGESKQITVWDDGFKQDIEIDLLSYICIALRYNIWGVVPSASEGNNFLLDGRWPFKHPCGRGLRLHTTVSNEMVSRICESRIVYMGCMH